MEEIVDPLGIAAAVPMVVGLSLSKLIVVVGESEILAPSVDVDFVPNNPAGHR